MPQRLPTMSARLALLIAACLAPAAGAGPSWWLPQNHSEHGKDHDSLFLYIFWLTSIVMVGVFVVMGYFLVKYRFSADRKKAHYSHGNLRVEVAWTIIPAFFLAAIVLWTKGVWDKFRYGDPNEKRPPARMLVVAQQFAWNVIYAGPDGKLGKYMVFPRPSDKVWPKMRDDEGKLVANRFEYNGTETTGPADLPFADAVSAINSYIETNPLGKDYADPDGVDDIIPAPGRIHLPLGRPVEIELTSKDVLHSFFLPNFRVKLDAVPGLRGVIRFVAIGQTTRERENDPANRYTATPDELLTLLTRPENTELQVVIDDKSAGAAQDAGTKAWGYKDKQGNPLIAHGAVLNLEAAAKLREAGVKQVTYRHPGYFDLVCEELCGVGHADMRGTAVVVTAQEYADMFEKKKEVGAAPVDPAGASAKR
ncbi:MAG TPA: cytochrome c oxidase subunit II transmembrane domain-containing protein [Tepidisphaeraceae bacterium]|nr:cytochrome c oxidase subunit II transmembrane domain-containing protein [Tepidisphaeraceae bacterium]